MLTTIQKDFFLKSGFSIDAKRDVIDDGHGRLRPRKLRCYMRLKGIKFDISEESYELLSIQMKGLGLI